MRGDNAVLCTDKGVAVTGRFLRKHVRCKAGNLASVQCGTHIGIVYKRTTGGVDNDNAVFHFSYGIAVDEVGVYTAVMTTADGGEYVDFFVHIPDGESTTYTVPELSVALSADTDTQSEDAISEMWFWLALGMLLILLTEWGWYYHEQY